MSTEITCLDGYTTDGTPFGNTTFQVDCLASGEFEEFAKNMCKPVQCGVPPKAPNATLTDEVSQSAWQCKYYKDGENDQWCQDRSGKTIDGIEYKWSGEGGGYCGTCWCCQREAEVSSNLFAGGCDYSEEACRSKAAADGLEFVAAGSYTTKGCYSYSEGNKNAGKVWYGQVSGGDVTEDSQINSLKEYQIRVNTCPEAEYNHIVKGCVEGHNIASYTGKTVDECKAICDMSTGCKAFEFGVAYGGSGKYKPGDCSPQDSSNKKDCDGAVYNLDLYIKADACDYSEEACRAKAAADGLEFGGASDYTTKGCYTYSEGHKDAGKAWYGQVSGGDVTDDTPIKKKDQIRLKSCPEAGEIVFGQKVSYKCDVGFSVGGEQGAPTSYDVECLSSGGFTSPSPDLECINVNDCEGHTCGPFGTCVDLIGPAPAYTCDCQYGYIIKEDGDGEKHCGQKDECKGADCGMGVCKDLIGTYTCICPGGYYVGVGDDDMKTCLPVMCSELTPVVEHSKLQTSHSGPVLFPKTLTYKCDSGYSMDGTPAQSRRSFQVQCKSDGMLHGLAECQPVSCGTAAVIEHTHLLSPDSSVDSIDYLESAKYECDHGYALGGIPDGEVKFTTDCMANGVLGDPAVCEPVVCGHAPTFPNSKSATADQMSYGQVAVYECDYGYSLDGTASGLNEYNIACGADGKFTEMASTSPCSAVSVAIPTIGHAHLIMYMGFSVGPEMPAPEKVSYPNTLTFQCDPGYTVDGTSSGSTTLFASVTAHGEFAPDFPDACLAITYSIRGTTQDAPTAAYMGGVLVRIEGTDFEATSSNGHFSLRNVPAGTHTVKYTKDGYITGEKTLDLQNDISTGGGADISMSPVLAADAWRVVLQWGLAPRDLDTYGMWGSYKACWYQKSQNDGEMGAMLEHDDTNSWGPETLHLTGVGGCTGGPQYCDIKYSVNDYTETGIMGTTDVSVTVYNGDSIAGTWHIADCQETVSPDQFWWHVFTIDGSSNQINWNCKQGPPPESDNFDGEGGDFEEGGEGGFELDLHIKGKNMTGRRTSRRVRRRVNSTKSLRKLRGKRVKRI
jgi:hypothetical protein